MSENEAIKEFKEAILTLNNINVNRLTDKENESLVIVNNLIENQQKEICRLQNIKRKDIQDLINNENENIYKNYISKDKIRAKIKSLEKEIHIVIPNEHNKIEVMNEFKNEGAVGILKELLLEE